METFRLKIRPLSPWQTPWQADTLLGSLCWAYQRAEGGEALKQNLLTRFISGDPPFILSDAFPGDFFPLPEVVRTFVWPMENRKKVGKSKYLHRSAFQKFLNGESLSIDDLILTGPVRSTLRTRNALSRITDTTGDPGTLFTFREYVLDEGQDFLSIYVRLHPDEKSFALQLFQYLQKTGFGADVTAGNGEFEIIGELEPTPWLDRGDEQPRHFTVLSTFQPSSNDPAEGLWQPFVKYGKLGPNFGLDNVFKRPLLMFRAGACFQGAASTPPWVGRVISMNELLSPDTIDHLRNRDIEVCHIATGLTVSYRESVSSDYLGGASELGHSNISSIPNISDRSIVT